eukprot:2921494-Amphidinium_carterae.1
MKVSKSKQAEQGKASSANTTSRASRASKKQATASRSEQSKQEHAEQAKASEASLPPKGTGLGHHAEVSTLRPSLVGRAGSKHLHFGYTVPLPIRGPQSPPPALRLAPARPVKQEAAEQGRVSKCCEQEQARAAKSKQEQAGASESRQEQARAEEKKLR